MIPEPSLDCAVSCGSQDFAKNKAQVENYLEEEEISDSWCHDMWAITLRYSV